MTLRVALVAGPGHEADAAWRWLEAQARFQVRRLGAADVAAALADVDVVWVHAPAPLRLREPRPLAEWVSRGGGLLQTLRATELVAALGIESAPPADLGEAVWHHDADEYHTPAFRSMSAYPHVRGIATWGPHPLVEGLHGGTYTWAPAEGERHSWACYAAGARPKEGRVVGVERAYIAQNPARVVAWEYEVGSGRALCLGAYIHFAAPDPLLRPQLETLISNALACVAPGAAAVPRAHWPRPGRAAAPSDTLPLPAALDLAGALPDPAADPIALAGPVAADEPWDVAGRRLFVAGREASGVREVWAHPHRAVAGWQVLVAGAPAQGGAVVVSADAVRRVLAAAGERVVETTFVGLEHPVAVVEYRRAPPVPGEPAGGPPEIVLRLETDLRRMWPFAAGCAGDLRFRAAADGRVAVVEAEGGEGVVGLFASRPVTLRLDPLDGDRPAVRCVVRADLEEPLRVAVVGGADRDDFGRGLDAVRRLGLAGLVRRRSQRAATMREARLTVRSDDPAFDRSVEWAKRRLDLLFGEAPGVGRSLLAGYAPSTPGWGDGRPGYAWFFGRDACWASFGLLGIGESSLVRQVLRFLGDRQDVTGKVLHEATTSGQFHYDAADSTPLYLLLIARYLAWTGDSDFVASVWPQVQRAFRFCLTTDTDADGLMENTRVGHGWIEDGPLGGAHVTLYLAALWRAALEGLAATAGALGMAGFQAECLERAARAAAAIEDRLWDAAAGAYALDLRPGGGRTLRDTALAAVPVLLRAVDPRRVAPLLDALGGAAFSAPWGVRLLPTSDPLFRRTGYHQGSVWPLFTGWASLAEYATGRGEAGFRHLAANARLAFARQRGAFDEVLHATEERGAGVCADQAWSASMVLQPLVEGLLGVEPDAPGGRLSIAPQLPAAWSALGAEGLRCGSTTYGVRLRRRDRELTIGLRRIAGPPLWITLAPRLASAPAAVRLDDEAVLPTLLAWGEGVRAAVSFEGTAEHELRVAPG